MRNFLLIAFAFLSFVASGADRITATISITNAPLGNTNAITIGGSTRIWTNSVTGSPGTLIQQTNSIPWSATNLLDQLTDYRVSQFHFLGQSSATNVRVIGAVGEALTVSVTPGWAVVTYSTQTVATPTAVVRVPMTAEYPTNRARIASEIVSGLSGHATNRFSTNATAMLNYVSKGASALQTVTAPVQLNNFSGTNGGTIYGGTVSAAVVTNSEFRGGKLVATNHFLMFSNTGPVSVFLRPDTNGFPVLRNRDGTPTDVSDSIGYLNTDHLLNLATATGVFPKTLTNYTAGLTMFNSWNSFNIFQSSNQVFSAGFHATTPVTYSSINYSPTNQSAVTTNSLLQGTNIVDGILVVTPTSNSGLANGYNAAASLSKAHVRLSGPSAAYTNAGFSAANAFDGKMFFVQFDNPGLNLAILDESGLDNSTNRVLTGTGGTLVSTNRTVQGIISYDTSVSRWRVWSFR